MEKEKNKITEEDIMNDLLEIQKKYGKAQNIIIVLQVILKEQI